MTANIIRHQCDYGRVERRRRSIPKIMEYRQQLTRMMSNPWNIGRIQRQTKTTLEDGASYATIPLSINPIWGISVYSLKEAQIIIEQWRKHYNTVRPHSSLGYRPPAPETKLPADLVSAMVGLRPERPSVRNTIMVT